MNTLTFKPDDLFYIWSSVNLTRRDGEQFLALAPKVPVRTEAVPYPLGMANTALNDLRCGRLRGAAVLLMD
jgi:alcohol dehydrogenase, propanol-preferring